MPLAASVPENPLVIYCLPAEDRGVETVGK